MSMRNSAILVLWLVHFHAVAPQSAHGQEVKPLRVGQSDRAIVFVHGFGGDPLDTFKNESGEPWSKLIESDNRDNAGAPPLSSYDVYTVDYTEAFNSDRSLESIASAVSDSLVHSPVFQNHNLIWFIAHSMGGLLIKRMVTYLQIDEIALNRVVGILFLGVPANGSPLAETPRLFRDAYIKLWMGARPELADELKPAFGSYLRALSDQLRSILESRRLKDWEIPIVYCGYESRPPSVVLGRITGSDWTVVPRLYAEQSCAGEPRDFDVDHGGLVRPRDIHDPIHEWARQSIAESFRIASAQEIVTIDPAPLGGILTYLSRKAGERDPHTGLPKVPITITYTDAESELKLQRFLLTSKFTGLTVASVLEKITNTNRCISLQMSSDRQRAILGLSSAVSFCKDGIVCSRTTCPR
jgi:pimeloyl-ACP methyl ester carboxylesterase